MAAPSAKTKQRNSVIGFGNREQGQKLMAGARMRLRIQRKRPSWTALTTQLGSEVSEEALTFVQEPGKSDTSDRDCILCQEYRLSNIVSRG